jgi:hypothetical protein
MADPVPFGQIVKMKEKGGECVTYEEQVIEVALGVSKTCPDACNRAPAKIVAMDVTAGIAAVAIGVGYGAYKGGAIIYEKMMS